MDEVFGEENCIVVLKFSKTTGLGGKYIDDIFDYLLWFAKEKTRLRFRRLLRERIQDETGALQYNLAMSSKGEVRRVRDSDDLRGNRLFGHFNLKSQTGSETTIFGFDIDGYRIDAPRKGGWKTNSRGMLRPQRAGRIIRFGNTPEYIRYFNDAPYFRLDATWLDTRISGFGDGKLYVVQTLRKVIQRRIRPVPPSPFAAAAAPYRWPQSPDHETGETRCIQTDATGLHAACERNQDENTRKLQPWNQRPAEPDSHYVAFVLYLSLGPKPDGIISRGVGKQLWQIFMAGIESLQDDTPLPDISWPLNELNLDKITSALFLLGTNFRYNPTSDHC